MGFELEQDDSFAQSRLERLELRYRRVQFVLSGAQAQYQSMRRQPGVHQSELTQAINRIRRAREQLEEILSTIEFLEDQKYSALAVRRLDDAPNASST
jgi:chromosome segregation ATPase